MKKFWEKYKVVVIVGVLLAAFIGLSFLLEGNDINNETSSSESSVSDWVNDSLEEKYTIAVIAQTTCSYCEMYKPVIESIQSKYEDLNIYWFHTDELSNADYSTLSGTYDISDTFKGTPYTMLTYHGVLVDYISGYVDEDTLVQFLIDNGVINE